jgi:hypothetical protein
MKDKIRIEHGAAWNLVQLPSLNVCSRIEIGQQLALSPVNAAELH